MRAKNHAGVGSMLVCLLLFAVGGSARADEIYRLQWVTQPNGGFLIRVAFKDGQSRLFVLDTGSPRTIIDRKVASDLHLTMVKVTQGNPQVTSEFAASSISFGPDTLSLPEVHFDLADLSALQHNSPDMAGIIGTDLLAKYSLRIDYSQKQVELIPGSVKRTSNEPPAAAKLPLTESEGHYTLAGKLDGVKMNFTLDTGAEHTFTSDPEVLKSLKPHAMLEKIKTAGFAKSGLTTKAMDAQIVRFQELSFGTFKFKNPLFQQGGFDFAASSLGNDVLKRFQMVIDLPAKLLYLTLDPAFQKRQTEGICTFPFETVPGTQLPLLSLSLDGKKPHLFLIDPGTPNSFILQRFVKSEHLTIQKIKTEENTDLDAIVPDRTTIQAPVPFSLEKVPFVVEDLDALLEQAGPEVVGVLGANILRVYIERIDFSKKTLTLFSRDDATPLGEQGHLVPLQQEEDGYYLNAKVDGNPTRFDLYFRYPITLLQEAPLLSMLKPVAKTQDFMPDGGAGIQTLRLKAVSVGNATWTSPIVEHNADPAESENVLGMDFLSRFYVTLDLGGKQVYLEPDPNYREDRTQGVGAGFRAEPGADGTLKVASITVPSPASEAGLKAGDDILEIDGMPIATTPLATIFAARKRAEGTPIKLKIQRKGEDKPREFTFQSRKLL